MDNDNTRYILTKNLHVIELRYNPETKQNMVFHPNKHIACNEISLARNPDEDNDFTYFCIYEHSYAGLITTGGLALSALAGTFVGKQAALLTFAITQSLHYITPAKIEYAIEFPPLFEFYQTHPDVTQFTMLEEIIGNSNDQTDELV